MRQEKKEEQEGELARAERIAAEKDMAQAKDLKNKAHVQEIAERINKREFAEPVVQSQRAKLDAWNAQRAEERAAEKMQWMEEWRLCDKVGEEQKKEKARRRQEEEEEEARKKPKKDEAEGKEADDGQQDQPEEDGKDGLADSQATLALGEVPGGGASGCLGGCLGDHRVTD